MRLSPERSEPGRSPKPHSPRHRWPVRVAALVVLLVATTLAAGCSDTPGQSAPLSSSQAAVQPTSEDAPVIAVVGDSYTTGSLMDSGPASTWSALMADELRRDRPELVLSVEAGGGSGYTTGGFRQLNFEQLAQLSMPAEPDLIIVFGSLNDFRSRPSEARVAARSLMGWLVAERPDATILVIGPPWRNDRIPNNLLRIRDELRTVALESGANFIDPLAEGWFSGESSSLIGEDELHPTDAGHRHLAELITPRVEQLLASRPTP